MTFWIREFVMEVFSFFLKHLSLAIPKKQDLVLFGAFNGERFADNSAIIYKHVLANHPELRPVWLTNADAVIKEVNGLGGEAYKRRSAKGIMLSLVAPVYVASHSIKDVLMYVPAKKTPKLIYVHHGIPLRKGWLDVKNAPKKSVRSTFDKINSTNFMIAPSRFAAEQQNRLIPIGLDKFAITGLPRNDVFFDTSFNEGEFKKQFGLGHFDKIVLYAPTWRPWGATRFFPFADYDLVALTQFLEERNMCMVMRPHHVDLNSGENKAFWEAVKKSKPFKLLTHDVCPEVNLLCRVSDALITDYSSLYYDYLLVDRPVVFLHYDFERYNREIGFYTDLQAITHGHKPVDQKSLLSCLEEIADGKDAFGKKRNELKDTFYEHFDGNASERIVQLIKSLIR